MDRYDEKAAQKFACSMPEKCPHLPAATHYENCAITLGAKLFREIAADALDEAASVAQVEVNACESHAKATKGWPKRMHTAAGGVAKYIVQQCKARAAAIREASR